MTEGAAADRSFTSFCVVGLGGHARSKLIPAILANGQRLDAIVTRQTVAGLAGERRFPDLAAALKALPRDVTILIATPPAIHFDQASRALAAGFDVIVEKPAFITGNEARAARAICEQTGALLIEGFMHRQTRLYQRLLTDWPGLRDQVIKLDVDFLIPQMPLDTFRQGSDMASSAIYDIGCYPVSLLDDLGVDVAALAVTAVSHPADPALEAIDLVGHAGDLVIRVSVGVADSYLNRLRLTLRDDVQLEFAPFFFGPPGERRIVRLSEGGAAEEVSEEANALEGMLKVPVAIWRSDRAERWHSMTAVADQLERLANDVAAHRVSAQ